MLNGQSKKTANEEAALREAMSGQLKAPKLYDGENQYSKTVDNFLDDNRYDINKYVTLLFQWETRLNIAQIFEHPSTFMSELHEELSACSENLFKIIRHISKYNLESRASIRSKLKSSHIKQL